MLLHFIDGNLRHLPSRANTGARRGQGTKLVEEGPGPEGPPRETTCLSRWKSSAGGRKPRRPVRLEPGVRAGEAEQALGGSLREMGGSQVFSKPMLIH